jgi:phage head maturation protease
MSERPRLSDSVPFNERVYLIKTNAGDEYLERMEAGKLETIKVNFFWTRDRDKAAQFTTRDLTKVFYKVVQAYSGPGLERVR